MEGSDQCRISRTWSAQHGFVKEHRSSGCKKHLGVQGHDVHADSQRSWIRSVCVSVRQSGVGQRERREQVMNVGEDP